MQFQDTLFFRFMTCFWIKYQKFRGASRTCAILLNFLLLIIKLAVWAVAVVICTPYKVARALFRRKHVVQPDDEEEEVPVECEEEEDDLIFCQLFTLGDDMCLLVHHVEMCPDETAFIRVVGEEGYTPLYKRKVRRDKGGGRYIVFNGSNYYLDDSKTQPTVIKK